jgi:menaquinol-cytochrome c reductase iron-sulfur subunit
MDSGEQIGRRKFLSRLTYAIASLIGLGFGIPAVSYVLSPATQGTQAGQWIPLGPIAKVGIGTPTLFKATVTRQTGWISNEAEISAYVLTDNGHDFVAMSNVCTHLGCRVRWIAERGQFFCPCHSGVFDSHGSVTSGPPPRALDRYQVKVENGQLFILGG